MIIIFLKEKNVGQDDTHKEQHGIETMPYCDKRQIMLKVHFYFNKKYFCRHLGQACFTFVEFNNNREITNYKGTNRCRL